MNWYYVLAVAVGYVVGSWLFGRLFRGNQPRPATYSSERAERERERITEHAEAERERVKTEANQGRDQVNDFFDH